MEFKKNILDSETIIFKRSEGEMRLEANNLYPGCTAPISAWPTPHGSYGFAATRNSDGKVGMVTAGHVVGLGDPITMEGWL